MESSLTRLSQYVEALNIGSRHQHSMFSWQLARYFQALLRVTDPWESSPEDAPCDLLDQEERLYRLYGISCMSLRYFGELQRRQNWDSAQAGDVIEAIGHLHLMALNGELNLKSVEFNRLHVIDPAIGQLLAVSTDPVTRHLMPFDLVGWERVLQGAYPGARIIRGTTQQTPSQPATEIILSDSQLTLLKSLRAFWRLKQDGRRIAGYDPRPIPLIAGPSGSGKTALVRYFAQKEKLPMKDFNVGTWLVSGAKAEPPSLREIAEFMRENQRGVLFIDEIDKLYGNTDWTRHVQQEIFALLDARTDSFPEWEPELREKLVKDFFIVGAGTWQSEYSVRRRSLGFGATPPEHSWEIDVNQQKEIPEELLMRFNAEVLYLQPLKKDEFATRLCAIHAELGLPELSHDQLDLLTTEAVTSGRHNRWLEAYVSRSLQLINDTVEFEFSPQLTGRSSESSGH